MKIILPTIKGVIPHTLKQLPIKVYIDDIITNYVTVTKLKKYNKNKDKKNKNKKNKENNNKESNNDENDTANINKNNKENKKSNNDDNKENNNTNNINNHIKDNDTNNINNDIYIFYYKGNEYQMKIELNYTLSNFLNNNNDIIMVFKDKQLYSKNNNNYTIENINDNKITENINANNEQLSSYEINNKKRKLSSNNINNKKYIHDLKNKRMIKNNQCSMVIDVIIYNKIINILKPTYYEDFNSNDILRYNNNNDCNVNENNSNDNDNNNIDENTNDTTNNNTNDNDNINNDNYKIINISDVEYSDNKLLFTIDKDKVDIKTIINKYGNNSSDNNFICLDFLLNLSDKKYRLINEQLEDKKYKCDCCKNIEYFIDSGEMLSNTLIIEHNIKECYKIFKV